ncbi:CHASE domain-containing protein [Pseudoduganella flava]|uniref:CHASE domain-containing protein n=1 Tax=Pseudoduganella flava TaxID=871742 RepID=A0A562PH39_9BURK|nr:hypothetical protein GO485_28670 [Pseudoduganella flava]TWI43775.1 CHASE domain-containing protein [Pseudoduganella flava]
MKIRTGPLTAAAAGKALLCLAGYLLGAAACLALAVPNGNSSPLWLPTGIALAALLRWRRQMLIPIAAGSLLVNLYLMARGAGLTQGAIAAACAITIANLLAVVLAYWLIRHCGRALRRHNPLVVYGYLLAVTVAAAVSGAAGGIALVAADIVAAADLVQVATLWWLGDLMAMLLVTPLLAAWTAAPELRRLRRHWLGHGAVWLAAAVATVAIYRWSPPAWAAWTPFLLLVPVLWAAFAQGAIASTTVAALAAGGAVWVTLAGNGPFATRDQFHSLLALDMYLALLAIAGMVLTNTAAGHFRDTDGSRPGRWPVVTLALCLAITVAAWHGIAAWSERRIVEQFRAVVNDAWQQMDYRIGNYRRMLTAGRAFFDASDDVSAAEWRAYVGDFDLEQAFPGTLGLGYATWVPEHERAAFLARQRMERPGFHIWPEPAAWPAVVATYLAPVNARNERAIGFNLLSDPVRRAALEPAIAHGGIGSTAALALVQDLDRPAQLGFLMFVPCIARARTWARRPAAWRHCGASSTARSASATWSAACSATAVPSHCESMTCTAAPAGGPSTTAHHRPARRPAT